MPLVGQNRIEPRVVGSVADRVVVQERARLVEVVQHLRLPAEIGVQHVLRQLERQRHRVAIVVVRDVVSPVHRAHRRLLRVLLPPFVRVDHAVAPIGLDHRGNQRDDVLADVPDVEAVVHRQAIRQFHERRRRARFGRMNRSGDVVHRAPPAWRSHPPASSSILIVRGSASFARSALF